MSNISPLADRIRPQTLDDVVGQRHILGEGKVLRRIIESGNIPNMIFYGPSGTGKTTVANIAARRAGKRLYKLNATTASVSDIRNMLAEANGIMGAGGVVLYLDEIQNFNKKQQQSLLECIEDGRVTLIASTTENPYFYIYNAILSRSTVFEFKEVSTDDILKAVERGTDKLAENYDLRLEIEAAEHLAACSAGDVRKALTSLEVALMSVEPDENGKIVIDMAAAEAVTSKKAFRHDRNGDSHYDVLSAFQKSVRGSDPDAALHYLARLVAAGDLQSICRRILVMAAEDIGLAYPNAIVITKACVDSALQLGFPEAQIPLAEAVIMLATLPKSNSAVEGIGAALADVQNGRTGDVPLHLKDTHYQGAEKLGRGGYKYPHNYPNNYVRQQYLPDEIKGKTYYVPGNNKLEQNTRAYWEKIKGEGDKQ
ncbi:MAG: replication-associated recombination protein A [Oscillospiraceae bacterium]|nr:replication-associated recombination protein A [Oscillospiraceae bacterium]